MSSLELVLKYIEIFFSGHNLDRLYDLFDVNL